MKRFIKYIQNKYKNIFLYLLSIPNHMQREIYIERNTEPIVISSCFFLIPTIYSFYTKQYFYTTILLLTFGISANYWRKATYGFRRNLDLIFSKISFIIFIKNHIFYLYFDSSLYKNKNLPIIYYIISYSNLFLIAYFYNLSYYYHYRNDRKWMINHMLFHLFCNLNILLIINIGNLLRI
jgi:hypothetical protein